MSGILVPIEKFIDSGYSISIAIKQIDEKNCHCAIIYLSGDGQVNLIHLGWDLKLIQSFVSEKHYGQYFFVQHNIHSFRQEDIADWLDYVYKKNINNIHYGLFYKETFFRESGALKLGDNEYGLTCATFVLAVFISMDIKLINILDWEVRPEDIEWQKDTIMVLEATGDDSPEYRHYIDTLRKEIGCPRYRPEEVTASITFPNRPEHYKLIWERGEKIKIELSEKTSN